MELEKVMNTRVVRSLAKYYAGKGKRHVKNLFTFEDEKFKLPSLMSMPLRIVLGIAMKKMGVTKEIKKGFFSQRHNLQTIDNILKTLAYNGLSQPFRMYGPALIVWNYTNVCNLRCRYCYQSAGRPLPDELTLEEKIDLINQMVEAGTAFLAFSGGEPILGPHFWDVLKYASRFLHISIATNGTLLEDRKLVEKLADFGAKNVFVSLDGATPESHDYIRGHGNFNRTIRGIENLVANPYLNVGINMVVTKRNYHEVEDVLKLAVELGVNSFTHYNFIPTGRGKEDYEQDLSPEEREDLLNLLYDWFERRKETGLNIISTSPEFARIIYDRSGGRSAGLFHYSADSGTVISGVIKYAGGCGAGRVYAAVQPNGLVSPCVFMPDVIVGNVREKRLIDIWRESDLMWALSDRENYHFNCPKYRYICGGCRARAYAYGDILGGDPGCLVYKKLKEEMDKIKYIEELNEKATMEKEAVNAANVEGEKAVAFVADKKYGKSIIEEVGAGT